MDLKKKFNFPSDLLAVSVIKSKHFNKELQDILRLDWFQGL